MAEMNFGGVVENVVTPKEFSLERACEVLKGETIAVLGSPKRGIIRLCTLRISGLSTAPILKANFFMYGVKT